MYLSGKNLPFIRFKIHAFWTDMHAVFYVFAFLLSGIAILSHVTGSHHHFIGEKGVMCMHDCHSPFSSHEKYFFEHNAHIHAHTLTLMNAHTHTLPYEHLRETVPAYYLEI